MKKIQALILTLVFAFSIGCSTLNISEIKNLETANFSPLILEPNIELNNLRIDLIRNTKVNQINDSLAETENKNYHPLGFDLGNGLFYDLNKNLSLRIDYLLDFMDSDSYELDKFNRPHKNKQITRYSFQNDSLLISTLPRAKERQEYHLYQGKDSLAIMYKKRLQFAIVKSDSVVSYQGKKRILDAIYKVDDLSFSLNKRKKRDFYKKANHEIFLEKDYVISENRQFNLIEIKHKGTRKNQPIFKIKKDKNTYFVYDKNYDGLKIVIKNNMLEIYDNKNLISKYKLIKK